MVKKDYINYFLLVMAEVILCSDVAIEDTAISRQERSLVFGESGQIQVTAGFDLPVMVNNVTVTASWSAQATYLLPTNATEFSYPYTTSARGRDRRSPWAASRWQVYSYLEQALADHELDGRACLLRSVCEAARVPLHTAGPGSLLEEVLHMLLTPSEDAECAECAECGGQDFVSAEEAGRRDRDCGQLFPACPWSLLDLLSVTPG